MPITGPGGIDLAIRQHARERPADSALIAADATLTYTELDSAVAARAAELTPVLPAGGRAVLRYEPSARGLVTYLATQRLGAVAVPINPAATPDEMAFVLADARPTLLCEAGGDHPQAGGRVDAVSGDDGRWSTILYTSGTTSRPKGVVHSHRSILANLAAVRHAWRWTQADRLLIALPLYHTHGLLIGAVNALVAGGRLELLPRFDAITVLQRLQDSAATLFFGVPTMYAKLVSLDDVSGFDLAAMRLWVSGSAPLPIDVFERFERLFGQRLLERYGMTETGMNLTNPCDGDRIPGSVGFAFPGIEVRCAQPEALHAGQPAVLDAPPDETGEIVVRGDNLFVAYLDRPDAYAATFADDWFVTGDLATRDASGRFRIVGRASTDIIKSRGFKIGALEIEDVVARHPGVLEVAVIGVDHAEWGEAILAVVAPRPGQALDREGIREHCRASLTHYKVPLWVEVVDEIPKTGPGKYKKRELIDRYRTAYI